MDVVPSVRVGTADRDPYAIASHGPQSLSLRGPDTVGQGVIVIFASILNIVASAVNIVTSIVLFRVGRITRFVEPDALDLMARIESLPMTQDDYVIWVRHQHGYVTKVEAVLFKARYTAADRYDADLMHAHEHVRVRGSGTYAQIARCPVCRRVGERLGERSDL